MMFAPLEGWRHVKVTEQHTAIDYAHALKDVADHRAGAGQSQYPQQGIPLRSLPGGRSKKAGRALRVALHAQARQLARSGEIRLIDEISAWEHERTAHHAKSDWHFTTKDARIKLK